MHEVIVSSAGMLLFAGFLSYISISLADSLCVVSCANRYPLRLHNSSSEKGRGGAGGRDKSAPASVEITSVSLEVDVKAASHPAITISNTPH